MILDEFAKYLHKCPEKHNSTKVLHRWLWENLTIETSYCHVSNVLKTELGFKIAYYQQDINYSSQPVYSFYGKSPTGTQLLNNLYQFCDSYEYHQWTKFVNKLKPKDFSQNYE